MSLCHVFYKTFVLFQNLYTKSLQISGQQNLIYRKYTTKIKLLGTGIWFLESCNKESIAPKSMDVKKSVDLSFHRRKSFDEQQWLDLKINEFYSKCNFLELEVSIRN